MNKEATYLTWVLVLSGLATLGLAFWFIVSAILGELENDEETIFWDRVAGCTIPLTIFGICLLLLGISARSKRV